jgi:hypothetical protein
LLTLYNCTGLLYTPKTNQGKMLLEIRNSSATNIFASNGTEITGQHLLRNHHRRETIRNYQQSLHDIDQPLYLLLQKFGKIVPIANTSRGLEAVGLTTNPYDPAIELSLVCFHTLHRVASIKIEWVDSLSLHLEFDSYKKVLKIFRFPSPCLIMATNNSSVLSQ